MDRNIALRQPAVKKGAIVRLLEAIKEIIAVLFWLYVVVKVFVFDIDVFLLGKYVPYFSWLLDFKFVFLVGIVAVIWLITKNRYIITWSLYILFYPIIVLFWKIPRFVFRQKSWVFAFAFINATISFFKSAKYNFIIFAILLISSVIIFNFSNEVLLWLSVVAIPTVLLITYIRRFILIFRPSNVYQAYKKVFGFIRTSGMYGSKLEENIRNLPVESLNAAQLQKWTSGLQQTVLYNRICLFTAKKLRDYQNSRLDVVASVLIVLVLVILTIVCFAVINYGLFKIDNNLFSVSGTQHFFGFFYYSFKNLFYNSVSEIVPIMAVSKIMSMVENFFSLFLLAILVTLLLTVKNQRHLEDLNGVISELKEDGKYYEQFVGEEYKIKSINEAMILLEKFKSGLVGIILGISRSIE